MSETETPAAGSERPIQFRGREIWVKLPSPEQYIVWRRTLKAMEASDTATWNAEQMVIAYERTRKIIDSVILNQTDKTWLDDEWLDGSLDLIDTAKIIQLTTEAFGEDEAEPNNRAEKRAATPKKKAQRKVT
jgi:hypothetical protein